MPPALMLQKVACLVGRPACAAVCSARCARTKDSPEENGGSKWKTTKAPLECYAARVCW